MTELPASTTRLGVIREGGLAAAILGPLGVVLVPFGGGLGVLLCVAAVIVGGIAVTATIRSDRWVRVAAIVGVATGGVGLLLAWHLAVS